MKTKKVLLSFALFFAVVGVCVFVLSTEVSAETQGYYTYSVSDGEATIIDFDRNLSGAITIPNTLGGYPVTCIGYHAFYECTRLTGVTIPNTVTTIGPKAFESCYGLTNITIPDSVTSIDAYAFENCWSVTEVVVGNGVTTIGVGAFRDCDALTAVTIGDSVATVGGDAFYNCTELKDVYITDPSGWCKIQFGNDEACPMFRGEELHILGADGKETTKIVLNNTVTIIPDRAFEMCVNLTSITIPKSVTTIGNNAFSGCMKLGSITIPSSVTSIGNYAFSTCSNLKSIKIPNSVTTLGCSAFAGCESLTSATIGKGIAVIDAYTFSSCVSLTSITIPNNVTTIGGNAFRYCSGLKDVVIGDGVKTIDGHAFYGCTALTDILIPQNVENVNGNAFDGCETLTGIWAEEGSKHFSNDAHGVLFNKDKTVLVAALNKFVAYTVPDGVTTIGASAFDNCNKLISITIPDSVTTIGGGAFQFCRSLKNVIIPTKVTTIGANAFGKCYALTDITIPKSITYIGTWAFDGCDSLANVYYEGTEEQWYANNFNATNYALSYATRHYNHVHDYSSKKVSATCTENGSITYTCSHGDSYVSVVPALGHNYQKEITEATTTKNGKLLYKCTRCDYVASTSKTLYYAKTIKLSATSYTYSGGAKKPSVTVKDAKGNTISASNYTVTYASGRKNVGTYKVTVKFKGNYSGTKTLTFKINPISISKCSVKLSATSYVYSGGVKKPAVTVKNANGTKLTEGTHYTVTYASGRKNVGTYKVTIKMKGNYSGTKVLTFKIIPKAASINKLTAKTKAITVKLNRSLKQSSGYQIQYSTSKSFKSYKTATITKYTESTKTITGLKAKTTYYVRVRTYKIVSGTKIYSNWCTAKSVKTK